MPKGTRIERDGDFWTRYNKPNSNKAIDAYFKIAEKYKLDLAQMSLKFLEIQPFVTSVIIGATNMEQLKINIESVDIKLTDEVIQKIKTKRFKSRIWYCRKRGKTLCVSSWPSWFAVQEMLSNC